MKDSPEILVVGSFVKDLIVSTNRFPKVGETVLGCGFQTASGGKGANQAIQAARLGAHVTMVGKVGDDIYGKEMIDSCVESGIDCRKVMIDQDAPSAIGNVQLQVDKEGKTQNRIIVVPGANMTITKKELRFLEKEIKNYDMVLIQFEIPMEINEFVIECAERNGVPVMLNPAPSAPLSDSIMSKLTYMSPNEHEAADITGVTIRHDGANVNKDDVKAVINALLDRGVKNVLITLGTAGAAFGNENEFFICPSIQNTKAVDPTGAGDSFVGAFATLVSMGIDHEKSVRIANYVGALTVSKMGAQPSLPWVENVNDLIRERNDIELLNWRKS
ncbi:MAG: ribokinase [Lachnospiraceae bacterium]|nr:ribokinase [Lachnospiraceae bacterium]